MLWLPIVIYVPALAFNQGTVNEYFCLHLLRPYFTRLESWCVLFPRHNRRIWMFVGSRDRKLVLPSDLENVFFKSNCPTTLMKTVYCKYMLFITVLSEIKNNELWYTKIEFNFQYFFINARHLFYVKICTFLIIQRCLLMACYRISIILMSKTKFSSIHPFFDPGESPWISFRS